MHLLHDISNMQFNYYWLSNAQKLEKIQFKELKQWCGFPKQQLFYSKSWSLNTAFIIVILNVPENQNQEVWQDRRIHLHTKLNILFLIPPNCTHLAPKGILWTWRSRVKSRIEIIGLNDMYLTSCSISLYNYIVLLPCSPNKELIPLLSNLRLGFYNTI
jgi:hypothetical protein